MIIFRILILILILFELLNWAGILNFELDFTWLGLLVTAIAAWIIIEVFNYYFRKKTSKNLPAWIPLLALLFLCLDAFGDSFRLYSRFVWYDQLLHLASGIAICASLFYYFWNFQKVKVFKMGVLGSSVLAVCVSVMMAVFYEWEEYFEDLIFGSNRLGDGFDTANDMMLCFFGGVLVLAFVNLYFRIRKK